MRNHKSVNWKSAARLEVLLASTGVVLWSQKLGFGLRSTRDSLASRFVAKLPVAGQFIADFCAPSVGLIVELDGTIHARKLSADARRDLKLRRADFRIVRVSAELVPCDLGAAVAIVRAAL